MKYLRKIVPIFLLVCSIDSMIGQIYYRESHERLNLNFSLLESTVGAGLSFYDFNKDGLDDITIGTSDGQGIHTYISRETYFERIDLNIECTGQIKQILWIDYNNDNESDLFVSVFGGANKLFKNLGSLQFIDVSHSVELPSSVHFGYGATFGDINRDGWLDLYYNSRSGNVNIPNKSHLFLNTRGEYFTDITNTSGTSDSGKAPFCSSFLDINNDKWPDLYTAHDRARGNTLLINNGDGTFSDQSESSGTGIHIDAMCVNAADVTRNGTPEIYVTNIDDGNYFLVSSSEGSEYTDHAMEYGIQFFGTGWGSQFIDADNDTDLDLYVSGSDAGTGTVSSLFYERNSHEDFIPITSGGFVKDTMSSYSNAIGDFNNDGLIDIVVQNNFPQPYQFWENQSSKTGNYLKLELEGVLSNRDGIGSKIKVWLSDSSFQSHYAKMANGFLSQNSQYIHFGIGNNDIDSVIITWPTGHIDRYLDLEINMINVLLEGETNGGQINVDPDVILDLGVTTSFIDLSNSSNHLTIYPSLFDNFININSNKRIRSIDVIRPNGSLYQTINSNDDKKINLELGHIPYGLYYLSINYIRGREVRKVIKIAR